MKNNFKRVGGLVAIICAAVILFTACGGLAVKGEQINKEVFSNVIKTSLDAMNDGYITEGEMTGTYDGKKLESTMLIAIDKDENCKYKYEMSFNTKSVSMELYVITVNHNSVVLYKHNGKWKGISSNLVPVDMNFDDMDLNNMNLSGIYVMHIIPDSFEDLEYKNGRYYYSFKLLEEKNYSEAYVAFKDGKYVGASIKYENENGSASAVQKTAYSTSVKVPEYEEGSVLEYTDYVQKVKDDFVEFFKEIGNYLK